MELGETVRFQSVQFIDWLIPRVAKRIVKEHLVGLVMGVVLKLMATLGDYEDEVEVGRKTETMNKLVQHIAPGKLIPKLLVHLETAKESADWQQTKAAYFSISIIVEKCRESLRHADFCLLAQKVKSGITGKNEAIRDAASIALGKFSLQDILMLSDVGNTTLAGFIQMPVISYGQFATLSALCEPFVEKLKQVNLDQNKIFL